MCVCVVNVLFFVVNVLELLFASSTILQNCSENTAFKAKGGQYTAGKVTEYNVLFNIVWRSIFVGYLPYISVMFVLDVSLVPRVSLRLGYRSRPNRICNDMSLSLLPFLSIFTGFQHKCL